MTLRNLTLALYGIALSVPGVYAANLGFQFNGGCLDGSCPAQPLAVSGTASLPLTNTVTLANGDVYNINGTLSSTNNSDGGGVYAY